MSAFAAAQSRSLQRQGRERCIGDNVTSPSATEPMGFACHAIDIPSLPRSHRPSVAFWRFGCPEGHIMAGVVSRRDVIAGAGASALALSSGGFAAPGAVARGTVFDDDRGGGIRRAGARGIAGAMVSNGRDVAVTDGDGRWSLPVEVGDSVFVIKPPGWATPLSTGGL